MGSLPRGPGAPARLSVGMADEVSQDDEEDASGQEGGADAEDQQNEAQVARPRRDDLLVAEYELGERQIAPVMEIRLERSGVLVALVRGLAQAFANDPVDRC